MATARIEGIILQFYLFKLISLLASNEFLVCKNNWGFEEFSVFLINNTFANMRLHFKSNSFQRSCDHWYGNIFCFKREAFHFWFIPTFLCLMYVCTRQSPYYFSGQQSERIYRHLFALLLWTSKILCLVSILGGVTTVQCCYPYCADTGMWGKECCKSNISPTWANATLGYV